MEHLEEKFVPVIYYIIAAHQPLIFSLEFKKQLVRKLRRQKVANSSVLKAVPCRKTY